MIPNLGSLSGVKLGYQRPLNPTLLGIGDGLGGLRAGPASSPTFAPIPVSPHASLTGLKGTPS